MLSAVPRPVLKRRAIVVMAVCGINPCPARRRPKRDNPRIATWLAVAMPMQAAVNARQTAAT